MTGSEPSSTVDRKDLFDIIVAVPPVQEQDAIVDLIENGSARLEDALAIARREVALLREYRTRLIADVVTGKLDVREGAVRLPVEAKDSEVEPEVEEQADSEEGIENVDLIAAVEQAGDAE